MAERLRVGLIGCGNVAMYALIPGAMELDRLELVALADPTPERLQAGLELAHLPTEAGAGDWRQLVERDDIEALIVATPQRIRPEIAIAAAESGKHLLCEKPLAIAPGDAWRMVEAAHQAGVVMATVHNYTFVPVYQALKEIVTSGEIGRLETATLNFLSVEDRPGTAGYRPRWRHDVAESGGGVLMDMLHAVYLGWWFFDERPTAVSAFVDRRFDNGGNVEDYALVRYSLPSGQVMVNMAWGKGPGGTELMGSEGRAIMVPKGFATHPFVEPDTIHVFGRAGERQYEPERAWGPGHRLTIAGFRDAVLDGAPVAASGADGAFVLEAVVGAYQSAATSREVALPLAPSDPVYRRGAAGIAELDASPTSAVRRKGLFGLSTGA